MSSHAPNIRRRRWNEIAVTGVNTGASPTCEFRAMFMIGAHCGRLRRNVRGETCSALLGLDRDGQPDLELQFPSR